MLTPDPANSGSVEPLVIWCIPSLVSVLLNAENKKGAPLTQGEVEAVRDKASSVMLPASQVPILEEKRGYQDIDANHAWSEWQRVRVDLVEK